MEMFNVFAEGYCPYVNGGNGVWSYVVLDKDCRVVSDCAICEESSSNEMDLRCVIEAIRVLPDNCNCVIYTSSQYAIRLLQGLYGVYDASLKHIALVKEYLGLLESKGIHPNFQWLRIDTGNYWNDYCYSLMSAKWESLHRKKIKRGSNLRIGASYIDFRAILGKLVDSITNYSSAKSRNLGVQSIKNYKKRYDDCFLDAVHALREFKDHKEL